MAEMIDYMERTRLYYRAQGFEKDYVWAQHDDVPFKRLEKPLSECRVTVVTTAVPHPEIPKPIRKAEHVLFSETPAEFDTSELSWDKESTHTNDRQSYFPLELLTQMADEGVIKDLSDHFHFVPTQYSHRATTAEDAPAIAASCIEENVDIALLIPL